MKLNISKGRLIGLFNCKFGNWAFIEVFKIQKKAKGRIYQDMRFRYP